MRTVSLLIMLLCGLTSSAAPEMSVATGSAPVIIAGAADEADYQALQSEADLALAVLTRAQGQRVAMAQLAAD